MSPERVAAGDVQAVDVGRQATVPEGMTPDALRSIAGWLDLYDDLTERFILQLKDGVELHGGALAAVRGSEVQDDLRRWADDIEAQAAARACPYGDPACPCQDGDQCHYEGENPMTPPAASGPKEDDRAH